MGLSRAAVRFLVREHRRKPLGDTVLTLGRQCVYATYQDLQDICRDEGVALAELPPDVPRRSNMPAWRGTPRERYTSDVAVFRTLGAAEVLALDCSAFEGAEVIHDLNQPLPEHLASRFDLVLDAGTLEHVFDVRSGRDGRRIERGDAETPICTIAFRREFHRCRRPSLCRDSAAGSTLLRRRRSSVNSRFDHRI